jgi:hypothetical protein
MSNIHTSFSLTIPLELLQTLQHLKIRKLALQISHHKPSIILGWILPPGGPNLPVSMTQSPTDALPNDSQCAKRTLVKTRPDIRKRQVSCHLVVTFVNIIKYHHHNLNHRTLLLYD